MTGINSELRKDCPMRHENGNCTPCGGFCTAVNDHICEGLHNAYDAGWNAAFLRAHQEAENEPRISDTKIVQCRDCIYQSTDTIFNQCWCNHSLGARKVRPDDFCSYGKGET